MLKILRESRFARMPGYVCLELVMKKRTVFYDIMTQHPGTLAEPFAFQGP